MDMNSDKFRAYIKAWIVANICDGDPDDLKRTTMCNYKAQDMLSDFEEILEHYLEDEECSKNCSTSDTATAKPAPGKSQ